LLDEFYPLMQHFEMYYYDVACGRKQNKKLQWIPHLGNALLVTSIGGRAIDIALSTKQACILLLFNEQLEWSVQDMAAKLCMPLESLIIALRPLVFGNHRVLKRIVPPPAPAAAAGETLPPEMELESESGGLGTSCDGFVALGSSITSLAESTGEPEAYVEVPADAASTMDVPSDDQLHAAAAAAAATTPPSASPSATSSSASSSASSSSSSSTSSTSTTLLPSDRLVPVSKTKKPYPRRLKIADGINRSRHTQDAREAVTEDRRFQVDAAIVRLLKTRKSMQLNDIISEAAQLLLRHFNADPPLIKERIEALVEQQYLVRDHIDPRVFNYLA